MASRYKPMRSTRRTTSQLPLDRRAWLRLDGMQAILYRRPGPFLGELPDGAPQVDKYAELVDEFGDEMTISFVQNAKVFSINLSRFTAPELAALQGFINAVFNKARPIVEARDQYTEEVHHEYGEDSFDRLYRELPRLVVRAGEVFEYDQSVLYGPPNAPGLGRVGLPRPQGAGEVDDELDELDASDGEPEDDGEANDLGQGVRALGEDQKGRLPF